MKQNILTATIVTGVVALAIFVSPVSAETGQYGQYGQYGSGSPSEQILIDKLVTYTTETKGATAEAEYVDNLSASDYRFKPGQQVYFKIKIKNTADTKLTNVTVTDILPMYVQNAKGDGAYDKNNNTITIKTGTLNAGQEKEYRVTAQIKPQDQLPADKGILCMVNRSDVSTDQNASDTDTAQFCVERQVEGVKNVPATGPEAWALLGLVQMGALAAGLKLRKTS